ncbi:MAG: bifunctional N-acetylglucosamine-1-phosphate uridyltransferase/glucosamine-1-phosphate acetyltransferase [Candidatus Omnitrophica bacterium]|nr:bifunctional N-acetylglucosamine-1-phosphate uridyltransferase/glucosamine-1-phosphate acetyltransferase [Candidatus Omnitrophota bacterium]
MPKNIKAVILAAGLGTRMKSQLPKVLHPLCGKPMIEHVVEAVRLAGIRDIICVAGYKSHMLKSALKGVKVVKQKRPLGSADALKQAKRYFKNFNGDIMVLCGDEPLIKTETLKRLINEHKRNGNYCTLLSARMPDPSGYGRIVRDGGGKVINIVEETEVSEFEKSIDEINTGTYCFKGRGLFSILNRIRNNNKKKEYFLTDAIPIINKNNLKADAIVTEDSEEALGVNSRKNLALASDVLRKRILAKLMKEGVTIVDPNSTYIDKDVKIGQDTTIYPSTIIEGNAKIGRGCRIGPFARIRPGCEITQGAEVGNFVELVRTKIGKGTRVKHHTYLGDTIVGNKVNIGAGTITANYDGKNKQKTYIDDGAFIGVGTILIAPVRIGKGATTGAGSVVTKNHNVPPKAVVAGVPAKILKQRRRK